MSPRKADLWHRLDLEARAELIVNDERREWILSRYPPSDCGRPGIIIADDGRTRTKAIAGEDYPENEQEPLEDEGELVAQAAAD